MVIALGGNALGKTPEEQLELIKSTAKSIVDLIESGYEVVVTHGNGPQVGMIKVATDTSAQKGGGTPVIPFAECGAMSQGYIGYHLQQALQNEMNRRGISKGCAAFATQTLVDEADPAFENPTKPVGAFFTAEEAKQLAEETGNKYVEDAGRGWRWVVASPLPKRIVEAEIVEAMIATGAVVITAGGGGIPVVERDGVLHGVPAVIDKDRSAALLAHQVGADLLVILTAVDQVFIDYNKPTQKAVAKMNVAEAEKYCAEGQFAPGSMLPKVEACLEFVKGNPEGKALITSLEQAKEALAGNTGTYIAQ